MEKSLIIYGPQLQPLSLSLSFSLSLSLSLSLFLLFSICYSSLHSEDDCDSIIFVWGDYLQG